jgi:acyl dehydratase
VIDRKWIGYETEPSVLAIERGRLKLFAKATGETNRIYTDVQAALAAGYADLPAPPTFLFSAELDSGALFELLAKLDVAVSNILHGQQGFKYFKPVVAGDTVTVTSRIVEIYEKRQGALEFISMASRARNQLDEVVATFDSLIIVRH